MQPSCADDTGQLRTLSVTSFLDYCWQGERFLTAQTRIKQAVCYIFRVQVYSTDAHGAKEVHYVAQL